MRIGNVRIRNFKLVADWSLLSRIDCNRPMSLREGSLPHAYDINMIVADWSVKRKSNAHAPQARQRSASIVQ